MKMKRAWLWILVVWIPTMQMSAQGIEFFHGPWKDALTKAKETGKLIFVDANTSWCGPCRAMANRVFPDPAVGAFFNEHFINLKIDMEKGDADFRSKYPVHAYPTLFFIDETGAIVKRAKGYHNPERLLKLARQALAIYDNIDAMDDLFAKGKKDAAFLRKYVKALRNAGKPSAKVVNEYLRTQKDLTTKENLLFIFNAVTAADSKVFDLLIRYRDKIEKLKSKEEVNQVIEKACRQTVKTAIEFQDESLLSQAKQIMKAQYPAKAAAFGLEADLTYYAAVKDADKYLKAAKRYAKAVRRDPEQLHSLAFRAWKAFPRHAGVLELAESCASKAAKKSKDWEAYFTLAQILAQNHKIKEARQAGEKALHLASEAKVSTSAIHRFLQTLSHRL